MKKANLLDYLYWRGDLTFEQCAFCEVDALVLCQLSYLNLDSLVPASIEGRITIERLWEKFSEADDFQKRSKLGALISESTVDLLEMCAKSARFGKCLCSAYVDKIDLEKEEQFSAITFFRDKKKAEPFIAFRGTDDTIIGWKEDFNLATKTSVPAQRDALEYLADIASKTRGKISVGGHSKGGHLAIYASVFAKKRDQRRISKIFNFDGPGFKTEVIESEQMSQIVGALHSFYPQSSIVGMLFRHTGKYSVVRSEGFLIEQHEPFSWNVCATGFETLDGFDEGTEIFYKTFNDWLESTSTQQHEIFVETLFDVVSASNARTNSELGENWFGNSIAMIKAMGKIDKKNASEIMRLLKQLFDMALKNIAKK